MRSVTYSSKKESMPRASVFLKDEGTEKENDLLPIFFHPSWPHAAAQGKAVKLKMKPIVTAAHLDTQVRRKKFVISPNRASGESPNSSNIFKTASLSIFILEYQTASFSM